MSDPIKVKKFILGVDPGLSGAMAILAPLTDELIDCFDVPTLNLKVGSGRRTIDVATLSLKISSFSDDIAYCVFEEVHSSPNDGHVGAFSFGKATGILLGVLGSFLIPVHQTPPAVWKNVMGLSSNKTLSRNLASTKFPKHAHLFKRVKDDGRAEAALLADFGKRFWRHGG